MSMVGVSHPLGAMAGSLPPEPQCLSPASARVETSGLGKSSKKAAISCEGDFFCGSGGLWIFCLSSFFRSLLVCFF